LAKKILIVDDEPSIVKGIKFSLEQDGYETDVAYDGNTALNLALSNDFDLMILDLMLPGLSGMDVCQQVREQSALPIIMLTAKDDDLDKIMGLEYGADDYMTKPFNILELKVRIKSILRRTSQANSVSLTKDIVIKDLCINFDQRSVSLNNQDINLTAKEFDMLKLFVTNRGKVFSREQLLELVWKYDYLGDLRTVDVHIRRLREKIEPDPRTPQYIHTKWGVGYYFAE